MDGTIDGLDMDWIWMNRMMDGWMETDRQIYLSIDRSIDISIDRFPSVSSCRICHRMLFLEAHHLQIKHCLYSMRGQYVSGLGSVKTLELMMK